MENQASPLIYSLAERPKHKAFLFSRKKVVAMFGGYGSGKTVFACIKTHLLCETFPNNRAIVGRKTFPALMRSTLKAFLEVAEARNGGTLNEGPIIKKYVSGPTPTLFYQNGSVVEFTTLESDQKIRGAEVGIVMIDQAEEVAEKIYLELIGRARYWNKPRREAYGNSEAAQRFNQANGYFPTPFNQIIVVGNPAPNWCRREFSENPKGLNDCYQVSTMENQKYLPENYVEDLIARYPQDWVDRYIHGSWDAFGGQVYKAFDPHGLHKAPKMAIPKHWPRFVGWDHGYRNPTAIIASAVDEMGNIICYNEHYLSDATPEIHAKAAWNMSQNDFWPRSDNGKLLVVMDYAVKGSYGADGKSIWDHYLDLGIYGTDAQKDVHAGILLVSKYLQPDPERPFPKWHPRAGEMGSPAMFIMEGTCQNLVNEAQIYQWMEQKLDSNDPEAPKKVDDHAVDAWRYLVMAANKVHAPVLLGQKSLIQQAIEAEARVASHAFVQAGAVEDDE